MKCGEQHHKRKLNILQVESIRYQRLAGQDSYRKIAQRYGVVYSTIQAICTGRTWKDAPGPIEQPKALLTTPCQQRSGGNN